jgi:hypothetical protein
MAHRGAVEDGVPTLLVVDGFRFHFFSREGNERPTFEHQAEFLERWNEYFAR